MDYSWHDVNGHNQMKGSSGETLFSVIEFGRIYHVFLSGTFDDAIRLHQAIFANYTRIRPVQTWTDTVNVSLVFSLFQVKNLVSKYRIV